MFQFSVKSQSRHFSILPKENVYLATPVYFFQNSAVWKRVFDAALEFCLEACFHSNKSSAVSESFSTFYLRSRYTICVPEKCFVIAIFEKPGFFTKLLWHCKQLLVVLFPAWNITQSSSWIISGEEKYVLHSYQPCFKKAEIWKLGIF